MNGWNKSGDSKLVVKYEQYKKHCDIFQISITDLKQWYPENYLNHPRPLPG